MDQEKEGSLNEPINVLKINLQFSDMDLQIAMLTLRRQGIWKDGIDIDYFISGSPILVNISTEVPEAAVEMCMGIMAMIVGKKEEMKPKPPIKTFAQRVEELQEKNKRP